MFRFLKFIIHTALLVVAGALLTYLVIEPNMIKQILNIVLENFDERIYQLIAITVLIIYFVIFLFSYVERLFKKKKSVSVKTKDGKIEVTYVTLEAITKRYLETKNIIKTVKVSIIPTCSKPGIEANVECYKTENLNEKLEVIKKELQEHVEEMVGLKPKSINIKVTKIDSEPAVESIKAETIMVDEEEEQEQM